MTNCESVRELLSALYDHELEPDREAVVREHLETCPDCAQQLAQFAELSKLAADLRQPQAPSGLWSAIDASLDARNHQDRRFAGRMPQYSRIAIAATLLVAAAIALLGYRARQTTNEHEEMAVTFGQYLDRFHKQPERAQDLLLTRYDGRLVEPDQAAALTKFDPNAPDELPQGFARAATYVLKMPCCTCTQTIYKDGNGQTLALFEHSDEQRDWFGDRPTIVAQCQGKQACLVQLRGQLAACWKCGTRHLTLVGVRDVEQVSELVAYLDSRQQSLDAVREPS